MRCTRLSKRLNKRSIKHTSDSNRGTAGSKGNILPVTFFAVVNVTAPPSKGETHTHPHTFCVGFLSHADKYIIVVLCALWCQ